MNISVNHLDDDYKTTISEPLTLLATIDKLSGVDAFCSNEQLCPLLEAVWVTESHLGQRSTTAGIVDNILRKTNDTIKTDSWLKS